MNEFGLTHYVPVLRWKQAERTALAKLYERDSVRLTPLVELVPENFANLDASEAMNHVSAQIFQNWGGRPFFVDLRNLPSRTLSGLPSHPFVMLAQCAINRNLHIIPVIGIHAEDDYLVAIRTVLSMFRLGICLRLTIQDIKGPEFGQDLRRVLSFLSLEPEEIDLFIDYAITGSSATPFNLVSELIPNLQEWRNFISASGAFPEDLREFPKNDIYHPARKDWIFWRDQIAARPITKRLLMYSDYTIQYPLYRQRTGPSNYSASIRYTSDDHWVIMRGESVSAAGTAQWPANAALLCEQPEYCGDTFSYGDSYIKEKSGAYEHPGTPTTWLGAGINHHMTFVVQQLANLFGTSTAAVS